MADSKMMNLYDETTPPAPSSPSFLDMDDTCAAVWPSVLQASSNQFEHSWLDIPYDTPQNLGFYVHIYEAVDELQEKVRELQER